MEKHELTALERDIFEEMVQRNPGTSLELLCGAYFCREEGQYRFNYLVHGERPLLEDISPLARLEGLVEVGFSGKVCDLSPLAGIPTLKEINLRSGEDVLPCDLTSLKELRYLYIRAEHCTIPKLNGLQKLSIIHVNNTDSLEGLAGLESLKILDIGHNSEPVDLSPLVSCIHLEELEAYDAAIQDLTPLTGHPSLKQITLSCTKVVDVSPLSTIPSLERIWLYDTEVADVSCLASLPKLNNLDLRKTQVTDLSAFQGRENILWIERKKLGIKKAGKSPEEMKAAIAEIQEKLGKLGITPRPPLKRNAINAFQEQTGVKLPKEYAAFLMKIGDGFESSACSFSCLTELKFDPECVKKRFSHREGWCWEDDENATNRKIAAATQNGQIELADVGCGQSYCLIVCGGARGEVWNMTDVGIFPYGNGLDFLDWMKDFLDGKVI